MFETVFEELLKLHGPQHWWPADSRFEIIVGAVLVQRTSWKNASRAVQNLNDADALTPLNIARRDCEELESIIRPAGFFRVKAARLKEISSFIISVGGLEALDRLSTSDLRVRLLGLRGVGPETADAILGYAFRRKTFVMDAYARRFFQRLGFWEYFDDDRSFKRGCETEMGSVDRLNELHALIVAHCQEFCRPEPTCIDCPFSPRCAHSRLVDSRAD